MAFRRNLRANRIYTKQRSQALHIERLEPRLVLSSNPLITEFMASNDSTLNDGDGNSSDWIELYNPTAAAIDLAGWHLTDDSGNLTKWTFPDLPPVGTRPGGISCGLCFQSADRNLHRCW